MRHTFILLIGFLFFLSSGGCEKKITETNEEVDLNENVKLAAVSLTLNPFLKDKENLIHSKFRKVYFFINLCNSGVEPKENEVLSFQRDVIDLVLAYGGEEDELIYRKIIGSLLTEDLLESYVNFDKTFPRWGDQQFIYNANFSSGRDGEVSLYWVMLMKDDNLIDMIHYTPKWKHLFTPELDRLSLTNAIKEELRLWQDNP